MATAIPARRGRPRLGPAEGLTAATRGLAFCGLMLAGLGLLLAVLAALGLAALGVALLVQDQGHPHAERALVLLVLVVAAGLVLGRIFASAVLAGLRRVAIVTRRLAGEWCGVPIADPYLRRAAAPTRGSAARSGSGGCSVTGPPGGTCSG